jgi:hypothetical protein
VIAEGRGQTSQTPPATEIKKIGITQSKRRRMRVDMRQYPNAIQPE